MKYLACMVLFLSSAFGVAAQGKVGVDTAQPSSQVRDYPKGEVFGGYSYTYGFAQGVHQDLPLGFAADAVFNINRLFGVEGDFDYGHKSFLGLASIYSYDYMGGPRLSIRGRRTDFYLHGLVGGTTIGAGLLGAGASTNALSFGGGAGLNIQVIKHLAIRAFEVDYLDGRFSNSLGSSVNIIKIKTGAVFTF